MKLFILLSLISFSNLAFSDENPSKSDVIQAIKISIAEHDLECTQSNNGNNVVLASALDFGVLETSEYVMTINKSKQPVVTMIANIQDYEYRTTFTTNSDYSVVEQIQTVSSKLSKTPVNVGTIINPRIEIKVTKKVEFSMTCN